MENIVIVGSSGHAKVVIDVVRREGRYNVFGLLDRFRCVGDSTLGCPVLGAEEDLPGLIKIHDLRGVLVAIGDNYVRSRVVERVRQISPNLPFVSVVHPMASIAEDVSIGEGTVVMSGVSISPCSEVGRFCILNTGSSLDHDSVMGDFASLAPGATTGGNCRIGEFSAVGIGAVLIHGACVGEHAVIGAGAVVIKPIEAMSVAYGVPAQTVRYRKQGDRYL